MTKSRVVMVVSNTGFPEDIRVFKEAVTLSKVLKVAVIGWDRSNALNSHYETYDNSIEAFRIKIKSIYGNFISFIVGLPIFWVLALLKLIKLNPDVVHCHDFDTLPVGVLAKFLKSNVKVVFDVHEHYPSMISQRSPKMLERFVSALFISLPRFVDGIIVVNNYLKDYFSRYKQVIVVMNAPSLCDITPTNMPSKEKTADLTIFLFGGLSANRGAYHLLEVAKKFPNVELLIAGDGPAKSDILQAHEQFTNIVYLGWIPYEKILYYMKSADLIPIMYSSKILNNKIATPNKLFLAMCYGKPVIVYSGSLTSQIVNKEKTGFSISENNFQELTNIIGKLINNPSAFKTFSDNGQKAFRTEYNWEIMAKRLTKFYAELLID